MFDLVKYIKIIQYVVKKIYISNIIKIGLK